MDKKHFKDWHIILMIIVILSVATAGMLYAQKVGNDTAKEVEKAIPRINYLEKCFEVNKATRDGEYNRMNDKIDNLDEDIERLDKKIDKVIKAIEKLSDSAILLTSPLKEGDS